MQQVRNRKNMTRFYVFDDFFVFFCFSHLRFVFLLFGFWFMIWFLIFFFFSFFILASHQHQHAMWSFFSYRNCQVDEERTEIELENLRIFVKLMIMTPVTMLNFKVSMRNCTNNLCRHSRENLNSLSSYNLAIFADDSSTILALCQGKEIVNCYCTSEQVHKAMK